MFKRINGGAFINSSTTFKYNIMPHSTIGVAPSELLMDCRMRSTLDLIYQNLSQIYHRKF